MVLQLKDLVRRVRIKMNEDPADEGLAAGASHGGLTLDQMIAAFADEEIEKVLEVTVFSGFDDLQKIYGEIEVNEGRGRLKAPGDYHRMVELRITGWKRSATVAVGPDDDDYWRREGISPLVRGTAENPRVYVTEDAEGKWLELHPAEPGAEIVSGKYLSNPRLTPVGNYYIPDRSVAYVTTAIAERVKEAIRSS